MENDKLKHHLAFLYLKAFEAVLVRMNLRDTYFFQAYLLPGTSNSILMESIGIYIDTLMIRNDSSFLTLPDTEILNHFKVLAEEDINYDIDDLIEELCYDIDDIFNEYIEEETGIIDA